MTPKPANGEESIRQLFELSASPITNGEESVRQLSELSASPITSAVCRRREQEISVSLPL